MTAASPVPGGPEMTPDFLDRDLAADLTAIALAMARRFAAGTTHHIVAPVAWPPSLRTRGSRTGGRCPRSR